jgi:hypothetical protein
LKESHSLSEQLAREKYIAAATTASTRTGTCCLTRLPEKQKILTLQAKRYIRKPKTTRKPEKAKNIMIIDSEIVSASVMNSAYIRHADMVTPQVAAISILAFSEILAPKAARLVNEYIDRTKIVPRPIAKTWITFPLVESCQDKKFLEFDMRWHMRMEKRARLDANMRREIFSTAMCPNRSSPDAALS